VTEAYGARQPLLPRRPSLCWRRGAV